MCCTKGTSSFCCSFWRKGNVSSHLGYNGGKGIPSRQTHSHFKFCPRWTIAVPYFQKDVQITALVTIESVSDEQAVAGGAWWTAGDRRTSSVNMSSKCMLCQRYRVRVNAAPSEIRANCPPGRLLCQYGHLALLHWLPHNLRTNIRILNATQSCTILSVCCRYP